MPAIASLCVARITGPNYWIESLDRNRPSAHRQAQGGPRSRALPRRALLSAADAAPGWMNLYESCSPLDRGAMDLR